ncbi:MAG: prepilin-type N-terminal cleavage/methylation domain-containing protein [Phycisphaerales bacterium]|nr:prepilin-type N-terminal cleavage/methylation domain-containing protein [Phycisphaerales bacterium]
MRKQLGFTLVELLLSITILAMLATLAAPLLGNTELFQLDVVNRLLVSDIEHAQILAITHPEDEIALIIEEDGNGWRICSLSDITTPLEDSITGEPLALQFGLGPAASAPDVLITTDATNNIIAFDQNGGLSDFTQAIKVTLYCGENNFAVYISPTTGSIN